MNSHDIATKLTTHRQIVLHHLKISDYKKKRPDEWVTDEKK